MPVNWLPIFLASFALSSIKMEKPHNWMPISSLYEIQKAVELNLIILLFQSI